MNPKKYVKMPGKLVMVGFGAVGQGALPLLLRQGGNAAVQPGQPGYLNASDYVEMLDKPASVDRALGDVHPYGNPHVQTDPRNIAKVAAALADRLATLDAANAAIMDAVNRGGEIFLSHTRLAGRFTIRLSVGNLRTEPRHVDKAWELLRAAAADQALP